MRAGFDLRGFGFLEIADVRMGRWFVYSFRRVWFVSFDREDSGFGLVFSL